MERQLLEIHDAFAVFVGDSERQRHDALERQSATERQKQDVEDRLRDMERQKKDAEDRLLAIEGQKQDVERQLRKLQKTLAVRFVRFLRRANLLRLARERIR
jgi:hypothetical protein